MTIARLANAVDRWIARAEAVLLSGAVISLTVLTVGNVVSRKVFHSSWSFAEEISQFFLIVITFAGVGYAARRAAHICMTAFYDPLPARFKKVLAVLISLVTALLLFYLAGEAAVYVHSTYALHKTTPALRLPFWMFVAIVPVGLALGGVQYLLTFIKNLVSPETWVSIEVTADQVRDNP